MNEEIIKKLYKSAALLYIKDEADLISSDMEGVFKNATTLTKLDGVETYKTVSYKDLRDDDEGNTFTVEEALANTKQSKYSYFEIKEFVE